MKGRRMRIGGLFKDLLAPALGLVALVGLETAVSAAPAATSLIETDTVQPPRAYQQLCASSAHLCVEAHTKRELDKMAGTMAAMYGPGSLQPELPVLTEARLRQLEQVNSAVNATIQPVLDQGGDRWSFTTVSGDCEDYVLMKREMLARLGWPRAALRITVVHDGVGYHAILVVSTAQGDFVLDNMSAYVSRVEDSPYEFIVAQSMTQPGAWVRVQRLR